MYRLWFAAAIALVPGCSRASSPSEVLVVEHGFVSDNQPDGLDLDIVSEHYRNGGGGRMALYTDRSDGGREFAVLHADDYGSLPFDWDTAPNATVQGLPAVAGHQDDREYVAWKFCPLDGCDHANRAAIIARGFSPDEALDIAQHVTIDYQAIELNMLPAGVERRAYGPFAVGGLTRWPEAWYDTIPTVRWIADDAALQISTVPAAHPLGPLLRFVIDDPDGTDVRGHPGRAGKVLHFGGDEPEALLWTWEEAGQTVFVQAFGVPRHEVEKVIDSLRPATSDDWAALRRQATRPHPSSEMLDHAETVSGSFDTGSWTLSFTSDSDHEYSEAVELRFVDAPADVWAWGANSVPTAPDLAFSGSEQGTFFYGVAPRDIDRLEIRFADGSTLTPSLHELGPSFEFQVWGAFINGHPKISSATAFIGDAAAYTVTDPKGAQPNPHDTGSFALEPVGT